MKLTPLAKALITTFVVAAVGLGVYTQRDNANSKLPCHRADPISDISLRNVDVSAGGNQREDLVADRLNLLGLAPARSDANHR